MTGGKRLKQKSFDLKDLFFFPIQFSSLSVSQPFKTILRPLVVVLNPRLGTT